MKGRYPKNKVLVIVLGLILVGLGRIQRRVNA
jgi:hypothetical protein